MSAEVEVRKPNYSDLQELYDLIWLSTSGRTVLTIESLKHALFESHKPDIPPSTGSDSWFEFELKSIRTNKAVAQALVAEVEEQIVGYIISHYHYSPWIGHGINIDDIYVRPNLAIRGRFSQDDLIEKKLIEDVMDLARLERIGVLFFDSDRVEFNFMKSQSKWYRNNKDCDWSLLRISSQSI